MAVAAAVVAVLSVELAAALVLELELELVAMASALQTFGPDTPLYQPPPASRRVLFIPSCEAVSCELWVVSCGLYEGETERRESEWERNWQG